jgi:hypothetical protein
MIGKELNFIDYYNENHELIETIFSGRDELEEIKQVAEAHAESTDLKFAYYIISGENQSYDSRSGDC